MFERFTDKARAVVILAKAKATERGDQIRPVYMLHALASAEGVAARVLADLGVDADAVERQLDRTAPLGNPLEAEATSGDAEALATIGIDLDEIKRRVEESFGPGALGRVPPPQGPPGWTGRMTLTRESKQSLGLALKEARALRHNYIGTEHLLLGLLSTAQRNHRGDFTPDTLRELGIDPAQVRQRVLAELRRASALSRPPQGPHPAPSFRAQVERSGTARDWRGSRDTCEPCRPRANSMDGTSWSSGQHRWDIDVVSRWAPTRIRPAWRGW